MQCDSPACASACPTGASYTAADGVTLVDYEKCICCGLCVDACPYGARHINKTGENFFDAANPAPYEAYGVQRKNVVEKCIFCHDLVEQGGTPACVVNCPGKARAFGDIDDPTSTVVQKIQGAKRIGETGFYYLTPDSIPADMIISKVMVGMEPADLITPEPQTTVKAAPGISPVAIGVGAGVVVAAGVGAGLAINAKRKKAVDAGTASSTGAASSADTSAKEQKEDGNDA
jgi:molybdopterin-containing oxidoreductase family iron-sulfur binding subunit